MGLISAVLLGVVIMTAVEAAGRGWRGVGPPMTPMTATTTARERR